MAALKTLVIGGSGFIGPVLVEALRAHGHQVTVLNRGRTPVPGVHSLVADRNVRGQVEAAARMAGEFAHVVDVSCYTAEQASIAWETFATRTPSWLHVSTAAVYAKLSDSVPREEAGLGGTPCWGEYGRAKSAAEAYLASRTSAVGRWSLRPTYLYGPSRRPDRESFLWSRMREGACIESVSARDVVAQFVHVRDFATAVLRCLEHPASGFNAFNVGSRRSVSLVEYLALLRAAYVRASAGNGLPSPPRARRSALVSLPYPAVNCCVDSSRIRDELGWREAYDLASGLEESCSSWMRQSLPPGSAAIVTPPGRVRSGRARPGPGGERSS